MNKNELPKPTEEQEQTRVISWSNLMSNRDSRYGMLLHIPNGGMRSKAEAGRFRAAGVKAGVPDLFLPVAVGDYHGLWIEMKRIKGGRVSPEQTEWLTRLNNGGYKACVAHGSDEAIKIIEDYMEGKA